MNLILSGCLAMGFAASQLAYRPALAVESPVPLSTEKAQDEATDRKTADKINIRHAQQELRKADGSDNIAKDARDKANDVEDGIGGDAAKLRHKVAS